MGGMSTVPPPNPSDQQPSYQQVPPPPAYRQPMAQAPYNLLAIIGFVAVFFIALAGIILGHVALGQIKRTGERGHGFALGAAILGYVFLAFQIIAIIAVVVFSVAGLAGVALMGTGATQTVAQACSQFSTGMTSIQPKLATGASELGSDPEDAGALISTAAGDMSNLAAKISNSKVGKLAQTAATDAQVLGASAEVGADVTSDANRFQDSLDALNRACG
jgi:hypothetical protein